MLQHITPWQAQFYAEHGIEPPGGTVVQSTVQTETGPVFIDTSPTIDASGWEAFASSHTTIAESMITTSAPETVRVEQPLFTISEESIIRPVPATDIPDNPTPSWIVPTPEVIPAKAPTTMVTLDPSTTIPLDTDFQPMGRGLGGIGLGLGLIGGMFGSLIGGNDKSIPASNFSRPSILGGASMVMQTQAGTKLWWLFTSIGRTVQKTNGRLPMGKGFLSRLMQVTGIVTVADLIGLGNPFNNQSESERVEDMVADALESGAIDDNRAFNRATGEMMPMQAIIILYDRMGMDVERMYAVSFRPANPRSVARRTSRSNNTVRRRRTPARRSR